MRKLRSHIRNRARDEQGATLVLTVLGIVVLLGMVALAVDIGMLLGARTESQRVADAAALAGAGSLITAPDDEARARQWAIDYAAQNTVHGQTAVLQDQDVDVLLDEDKVRVRVYNVASRSNAIKMIFGRVLGWQSRDVSTVAAAEAVSAGAGVCPMPIAIPDRWLDNPGGTSNDGLFDDPPDIYRPYYYTDPPAQQCATWDDCFFNSSMFTGYYGDNPDYNLGDVIEIKTSAGGGKNKGNKNTDPFVGEDGDEYEYNASPCVDDAGEGAAWRCWYSPDDQCNNADCIRDWIEGCPPDAKAVEKKIGDEVTPITGEISSAVGNKVQTSVRNLVDTYGDDDWYWNGTCMASTSFDPGKCMEEISAEGAVDAPSAKWYGKRHRAIPIIDPSTVEDSQDPAVIAHWACVFIEKAAIGYYKNGQAGALTKNGEGPQGQLNVYVRFVRCSDGMYPGDDNGQALKTLRLVRY